jgi:hypothetical protein
MVCPEDYAPLMKKTVFSIFSVVWLLMPISALLADADIRAEFGGKRILFVDGNDIRPEPGGKRLLFIDADGDIRPEPGGKRLLLVDADGNVRPEPNGVRLAFWDGLELRRNPGGPRLGLLEDHDFRASPGGKRFFFVDGKVSRIQLTAVLYLLQPDLLKLSPTEKAAKEKEMAAAGAESEAAAKVDYFPGAHQIITHYTDGPKKRTGSIVLTKQGDYYGVNFKTGDQPAWAGIGFKYKSPSGDEELWAAVGPGAAASLGIYQINGGNLTGTWIPVNAANDKAVLGFENLTGSAKLGGIYQINSGKLPNGGVAYTGALNIDPLPLKMNSTGDCFRFRWATGTTALAFRVGDRMVVAAGWGDDYEILRLEMNNSKGFNGDFMSKSGGKGYYTIDNVQP